MPSSRHQLSGTKIYYPSELQRGQGSIMIPDGRVELIFKDNLILVTFSQGRTFCLYEDEIVIYEEVQAQQN